MDIQIPYSNNYTELIRAHDIIIESLELIKQTPERPRAGRLAKADFANLQTLAWGLNIILEEDRRILRALDKEDREYVDAFNQKLKEI